MHSADKDRRRRCPSSAARNVSVTYCTPAVPCSREPVGRWLLRASD